MATRCDDQLRKAIAPPLRDNYQQPRKFDDDILTECYADYINGPWNIRAGKQIVTWGELDVDRAADVINPIDLRWGVPGIEAWEEVKRPLWLIRTTYQSQLPGNLLFENIINPGHLLSSMTLPPPGTHWSADHWENNPFTKHGPGVVDWTSVRWIHEAEARRYNIKNFAIGFRVRGYTYNVDWTLLWWNSPSTGPVVNAKHAAAFGAQYIGVAIPAMITGKDTIRWNDLPDVMSYSPKVYDWKRNNVFAGTAQTTFSNFMPSAVWRAEVAYTVGESVNVSEANSLSSAYGIKKQNILATAVSWSDKWTIPWFTRYICTGKQMETTLTLYNLKIINKDKDLITTAPYSIEKNAESNPKVSLFAQLYMFNYSWVLTFIGSYQIDSERTMVCPTLSYVFPGENWRAEAGWVGYITQRGYLRGSYYDKDSVILRLRYEF